VETDRATDNDRIWHIRCACWITKATDTLKILIDFPRLLWLCERAFVLRCLSCLSPYFVWNSLAVAVFTLYVFDSDLNSVSDATTLTGLSHT
jgi:hypothetical protein